MDAKWVALKHKEKMEKMKGEEYEDLKVVAMDMICVCLANNTFRRFPS